MASIEAALVTRLAASTSLVERVGTRMYPIVAPQQAALPYIVYESTVTPEHHMGGRVGLAQCELTLEIHTEGDTRYRDGKQIATLIRTQIDGYRGIVSVTEGVTVEQVDIRSCLCTSQGDSTAPPIEGAERGRFAQVMTFSIGFFETAS